MVFVPATHTYLWKLKSGVIFTKLNLPGTLLCIFLIQARKHFGPTKYLQENKFRTTKYLRQNVLDPLSTHEKKFRTQEIPAKVWWHDGTWPIRPTMTPDLEDFAHSHICESLSFLLRFLILMLTVVHRCSRSKLFIIMLQISTQQLY